MIPLFVHVIMGLVIAVTVLTLIVVDLRERVGLLLVAWEALPVPTPSDLMEHDLRTEVGKEVKHRD